MPADVLSSDAAPAGYEADERIAARDAATLADERWRGLCTENAAAFVAAERRSAAVQAALQGLLEEIEGGTRPSVDRVGRALDPKYAPAEDGGEKYGEEGEEGGGPVRPATELLADLAEKHRLRRRTLMQHSSLLELLELPSLMDACVRSSLYEDALSIAGFANTLERRHLAEKGEEGDGEAKKGDVVAGVVSEIRRREADLRRMLIGRLRQDVTMPQCLEVVTALRRLNGVELERRNDASTGGNGGDRDLEGVHAAMEMRLQVDFLEARDAWLGGGVARVGSAQAAAVAAAAATSSPSGEKGGSASAEQILDGIERYRTRCFEIVTQFLAIFRGSFAPSSSANGNNDHSSSLLSMWTARRVQTFLTTLQSNITTHVHDTATLRDALDAASFFASSMGRVGADFQPLLAPIFEPRLVDMIVGHWQDGLSGMVETLKACRDAGVAGPLFGTETAANKDGDGAEGGPEVMQSSRTPAPPRKLLALPPLARFLNAYLGGLNELRRCLLPGAFPSIRSAHFKLVKDARMSLQANERAVFAPGLRGEAGKLREAASKMKSEFEGCLEPYMSGCLEVALGSVDYAAEEARKAAALAAEKSRIAAEKARAEEEARAKAKAADEARKRAEAEAAALQKAKAEAEQREKERAEARSALEKAKADALTKEKETAAGQAGDVFFDD
ncbi:hypothetical protein ACHAXT_002534 [Thalassiosira profunda]